MIVAGTAQMILKRLQQGGVAKNRLVWVTIQRNTIIERQGNIRCVLATYMTDQAGRGRIVGESITTLIIRSCHILRRKRTVASHTVHQQRGINCIISHVLCVYGNVIQ